MQVAAQFGEFTVSTPKQARGLPVGGVIVIDQGSELCDISAQFDVLGAPPHGGLASLCLRKLRPRR